MNNDLISRSALIAEYDRVHVGASGDARKLMEDAPAVDAVEIVRCEVCRYNNHGECQKPENIGTYWDEEAYDCPCYISVEPDHFCSYGERETDGEVTKVL